MFCFAVMNFRCSSVEVLLSEKLGDLAHFYEEKQLRAGPTVQCCTMVIVAAGILPAVEPGILPGGSCVAI